LKIDRVSAVNFRGGLKTTIILHVNGDNQIDRIERATR
jgi:hypothetical protein